MIVLELVLPMPSLHGQIAVFVLAASPRFADGHVLVVDFEAAVLVGVYQRAFFLILDVHRRLNIVVAIVTIAVDVGLWAALGLLLVLEFVFVKSPATIWHWIRALC